MRNPFRREAREEREGTFWSPDPPDLPFDTQVELFWAAQMAPLRNRWNPKLVERVWAANRAMQLTCQHLARMPLRWFGPPGASPPAWVSSPDPAWFPNGLGDALFAACWNLYGRGDAFLYIIDHYASGFPSAWTVLGADRVQVEQKAGRRTYNLVDEFSQEKIPLDADRMVQITRDPRGGLRGTSALRSFAASAWNMVHGAETSGNVLTALPPAVVKSQKKLTQEQAQQVKEQFLTAIQTGPPVLGPEIDLVATDLGLSPKDLLLLDSQAWDAKTIAAAFGIPAVMLNIALEGSLVYQAPGQLFDYWWRNELKPRADSIADALTARMLPRGQYVEFDSREALAPDLAELARVWTDAQAAGIVSVDEWRAAVLGLPPMPEQDAIDHLLEPQTTGASNGEVVTPLRPVVEARS